MKKETLTNEEIDKIVEEARIKSKTLDKPMTEKIIDTSIKLAFAKGYQSHEKEVLKAIEDKKKKCFVERSNLDKSYFYSEVELDKRYYEIQAEIKTCDELLKELKLGRN